VAYSKYCAPTISDHYSLSSDADACRIVREHRFTITPTYGAVVETQYHCSTLHFGRLLDIYIQLATFLLYPLITTLTRATAFTPATQSLQLHSLRSTLLSQQRISQYRQLHPPTKPICLHTTNLRATPLLSASLRLHVLCLRLLSWAPDILYLVAVGTSRYQLLTVP
jgi:hypothetical protein